MPNTLSDPRIKIFLPSRRLHLFTGEQLVKEYPVAIGKPSTPTPVGEFSVRAKIMYPGGVFGTRWMEFKPHYGIHGTNNPASIGTMASLGCVRMYNSDVEDLFSRVRMGTPVTIVNTTVDGPHYPFEPTNPSNPGNPVNPGDYPSTQKTYVVKSEDTLWKISQRFGTTIAQILAVNNIPNPHQLQIGQIINLP